MRDISRTAEVSLSNLYNYYETKEAIYESIINGYLTEIDEKLRVIFEQVDEPFEPTSLRNQGEMVGDLVNQHSDFWLLMYIDVLEFSGFSRIRQTEPRRIFIENRRNRIECKT